MDSMLPNELSELRDLAHRYLLEADQPVETQHIARHLFGPQRHERPETQVVVRSLLRSDPRFLRTHCRRWSARWAPHLQDDFLQLPFVVVDLETTGSVIGVDEIMEIGVVRLIGDQVEAEFSTRLRATRTIPPWVSRLTGLNNQDLADAPRLEDVAPRLLELLDQAVFVAHDIRFDMPFLRWEMQRRGLPFPCRIGACTLQLARAIWPDLPSYSLIELAQSRGLTHLKPHRAGDDALAAAGVLQQLLKSAGALGLRTLGDLMEMQAGEVAGAQQIAES